MTKHTKPAAPAASPVTLAYACTLCGVACVVDRDEEHALARLCDCCHGMTETEAHLVANKGASIAGDADDIEDFIATMLARGGYMHPLAERLRARVATFRASRAAIADAIRANADKLAALLPAMCFTVETVAHLRGLERQLLPMCDEFRKLMGEPMLANAVRS